MNSMYLAVQKGPVNLTKHWPIEWMGCLKEGQLYPIMWNDSSIRYIWGSLWRTPALTYCSDNDSPSHRVWYIMVYYGRKYM